MTHTSTEQPSIKAIIGDMREYWGRATHGTWGNGSTTHETVARGGREKDYKIADFRHADDAQFCDLAHAHTPRLLDEIEALQKRVQELEASQAQRVPLSDDQLSKALEAGGVGTQTHAGILNRVSWTTCGSIDPRKICRAIEAAHGITQEKQG